MSRPVRLDPDGRGGAGVTPVTDLGVDYTAGLAKSIVGFDTTRRKFGRIGRDGLPFEIPASEECSWYAIRRQTHEPSGIVARFHGLVADLDFSGIDGNTDHFLVLFIAENAHLIPAAQETLLQNWGLSSAAAIRASTTEKLAFVGLYGLVPAAGAEIRAAAAAGTLDNEILYSVWLANNLILH